MAGDDVDKKKPDPTIYRVAAERLKLDPKECLVVEDSTVGLKVHLRSHLPSSSGATRRDVLALKCMCTCWHLYGRWAKWTGQITESGGYDLCISDRHG